MEPLSYEYVFIIEEIILIALIFVIIIMNDDDDGMVSALMNKYWNIET